MISNQEIKKPGLDKNAQTFVSILDNYNQITKDLSNSYSKLQEKIAFFNKNFDQKYSSLKDKLNDIEVIKNFFYNILESMTTGVIAIDSNKNITFFNSVAEQIYNINREDLLHKPYIDFFKEHENITLLNVFQSGETFSNREKIITSLNGNYIPVRFSNVALKNCSGEIIGAIELFEDISELKRLENEVQQLQMLKGFEELIASIVHEIRNPLGGISGFAALLYRDMNPQDSSYKFVEKIVSGADRLENILKDLLIFAHPDEIQFKEVNLNIIIKQCADNFLRQFCYKNTEIEVTYPNTISKIRCSTTLLERLIHKILLVMQSFFSEIHIILDYNEKQNYVKVKFEGNGKSLNLPDDTKCSLNAQTTKKMSNLNFIIIKRIIALHNGYLDIENHFQLGEHYVITLPLINAPLIQI